MGVEMEKAFSIAAKEIHEAFQVAISNIKKSVYGEPLVCPNCGEKNPANAAFCFKCGKSLPTPKSSSAKGTE
jgi:ribosomal protein L40E